MARARGVVRHAIELRDFDCGVAQGEHARNAKGICLPTKHWRLEEAILFAKYVCQQRPGSAAF